MRNECCGQVPADVTNWTGGETGIGSEQILDMEFARHGMRFGRTWTAGGEVVVWVWVNEGGAGARGARETGLEAGGSMHYGMHSGMHSGMHYGMHYGGVRAPGAKRSGGDETAGGDGEWAQRKVVESCARRGGGAHVSQSQIDCIAGART